MKKKYSFLLLALFFNFFGFNKITFSQEQKLTKIRVAYHPNMGGASAIITGIKQGYFKEYGLDIELVKFTSGPSEIAAMIAGDIQIGYIGFGAHTLAVEGKVDIIATDGIAVPEGIRVRKDSGIKTVNDLKGKSIATQLGTSGEATITQVIAGSGLEKKDIKILNMEIAVAVAAFMANKIDAISVWPPYTIEIDKRMKDDIIVLKGNNVEEQVDSTASWIVTPKYLKNNRSVVINFVKGLYKAMDYRNENIDEVIGYVAELVGIDKETVMLEKYSSNWMYSSKAKQFLEDGTFKNIYSRHQQYFVETKRINSTPGPVEEYINLDIYKEALQ